MFIANKDSEYDAALNDVDQNLLVEYGLVKSFTLYTSKIQPIERAIVEDGTAAPVLKLLMLLDKQDEATLRLLHTYLELRLNIDPNFPSLKSA